MTRKISSVGKQLKCLEQVREFPLMSALTGRRSRRVSKGALIDAGPFSYQSRQASEPLTDFEKMIIITTMAGNTGWSHLIPSNKKYAPYLPNYAGSAAGRTFPSAAGFHTMDLFFSDDSGIYFLSTRDSKPSEHNQMAEDMDIDEWLKETWKMTKKISDTRIQIPRKEPHIESHNLWVANTPGSLFAIPVTDLAQHVILGLCYFVQNGYGITDDFNKKDIPGLQKFSHLIDLKNLLPLSYLDQMAMAEATVELSTACFSGCLLLQAMGLGGWMYDGINPYSVFGVTGDPDNKGLGFKAEMKEDWIFPNPTGLEGIFETMCPPHFPSMKEAVRAVVERKFGKGGPFHPDTPGAWKDTQKIRKSAAPHTEEFIECVTLMGQYILDTFGRFPATVPAAWSLMYLQAFHLDTEFYDRFYKPGSYLYTHAQHDKVWH
jgi:hypothetical protein